MKHIIFHNRKIVVVNGQPYYQSTGENSGMPNVWLPFYGCSSNKPVNCSEIMKHQKITRTGTVQMLNGASRGVLVKFNIVDVIPADNKSSWCNYSVQLRKDIEKK